MKKSEKLFKSFIFFILKKFLIDFSIVKHIIFTMLLSLSSSHLLSLAPSYLSNSVPFSLKETQRQKTLPETQNLDRSVLFLFPKDEVALFDGLSEMKDLKTISAFLKKILKNISSKKSNESSSDKYRNHYPLEALLKIFIILGVKNLKSDTPIPNIEECFFDIFFDIFEEYLKGNILSLYSDLHAYFKAMISISQDIRNLSLFTSESNSSSLPQIRKFFSPIDILFENLNDDFFKLRELTFHLLLKWDLREARENKYKPSKELLNRQLEDYFYVYFEESLRTLIKNLSKNISYQQLMLITEFLKDHSREDLKKLLEKTRKKFPYTNIFLLLTFVNQHLLREIETDRDSVLSDFLDSCYSLIGSSNSIDWKFLLEYSNDFFSENFSQNTQKEKDFLKWFFILFYKKSVQFFCQKKWNLSIEDLQHSTNKILFLKDEEKKNIDLFSEIRKASHKIFDLFSDEISPIETQSKSYSFGFFSSVPSPFESKKSSHCLDCFQEYIEALISRFSKKLTLDHFLTLTHFFRNTSSSTLKNILDSKRNYYLGWLCVIELLSRDYQAILHKKTLTIPQNHRNSIENFFSNKHVIRSSSLDDFSKITDLVKRLQEQYRQKFAPKNTNIRIKTFGDIIFQPEKPFAIYTHEESFAVDHSFEIKISS